MPMYFYTGKDFFFVYVFKISEDSTASNQLQILVRITKRLPFECVPSFFDQNNLKEL